MANNASKKTMEIPEYHRMELGEIFEKTRTIENVRIQLGTFIGTVNLSALGVAFSSERAGIVFIAIGAIVLFILMDMVVIRKSLKRLNERGAELEEKYSPDPKKSNFHKKLSSYENIPSTKRLSLSGFWLPTLVSLVEFILAVYLLYSGWALF